MTFVESVCRIWKEFGTHLKAYFGDAQLAESGPLPYTPQIAVSISTAWTGCKMDTNPQEMTLNRMIFTDKSTIGELWIDGHFQCYVLEPSCRDKKSLHPAIPSKRYLVNIQYSNKFGRKMPHIVDVPDRTDILIHWGNFPDDTEGCLITGETKGIDYVGESRVAFDKLWPIILERTDNRLLFITVLGGRAALDV